MSELKYISKNQLKQVARLREKKQRDIEARFIVEGLKNIRELFNSEFQIIEVFLTEKILNNHPELMEVVDKSNSINYKLILEKDLKILSETVTPQGIFAIVDKFDWSEKFTENIFNRLIYLDQISDPGNLAAVIRNAAWFGFDGILLSPESVEIYSPKVIRGSAGAVFHMPAWEEFNIEKKFEDFSSYIWIGADPKAKADLKQLALMDKVVLCLGNESWGLSESVYKRLNRTVRIPSKNVRIESLNLAVASAIIMYELTRDEAK